MEAHDDHARAVAVADWRSDGRRRRRPVRGHHVLAAGATAQTIRDLAPSRLLYVGEALTLGDDGWSSEFVPNAGSDAFTDQSSATCAH